MPVGSCSAGTGKFQVERNLVPVLVLLVCTIGCMRRDGRNSDCKWPGETSAHSADARHLSADAEFAEDLAIRYADTHHGLRTAYYVSGQDYAAARERCMGTLFEQIAKEHGVPIATVYASLGDNRGLIDLAINLPFALIYLFTAAVAARMIWRRYRPADEGWIPGVTMMLFVSLTFAAAGTMVGEQWAWVAETYRIGNQHMSLRAYRLIWDRHGTELFAAALIVFWLAAAEAARHIRSKHSALSGAPSMSQGKASS